MLLFQVCLHGDLAPFSLDSRCTGTRQVSIAKIIGKRIIRHDALYIDYREEKAQDLREGKPETVARCLLRITSCIQAVRDLNSMVTRYGPFNMTHVHTYPTCHDIIDYNLYMYVCMYERAYACMYTCMYVPTFVPHQIQ